jgi:hypothetical protein
MNNNLTLKFDFKTETTDCAYSLLSLVMEKLKILQEKCEGLRYIEVNLFKPEESDEDSKTALFKLVSDDQLTITEYGKSKRWEDALLNAFDKVKEKFLGI